MQSDPLCPACTEAGRLVGRDDRGYDLFACLTGTCAVVEYDRDIIRRREGIASVPPAHVGPGRRGQPSWWLR